MASIIYITTINERETDKGVTIEGVLLKDGVIAKSFVGLGNVENLKVKLDATSAPTVNDDSSSGYGVGSRWMDIANKKEYVCLYALVGAAFWAETTAQTGYKKKVIYIPLGAGYVSTQNTEYVDAEGDYGSYIDIPFNVGDYEGTLSFKVIYWIGNQEPSTLAYAQFYNVTDAQAVPDSEASISGGLKTYRVESPVITLAGNKMYKVQIKSGSGSWATTIRGAVLEEKIT